MDCDEIQSIKFLFLLLPSGRNHRNNIVSSYMLLLFPLAAFSTHSELASEFGVTLKESVKMRRII